MKIIIISILTIFLAVGKKAAQDSCSRIRYGTFEIRNEDGSTYTIIRSGNKQTEEVGKSGLVSQFEVRWVDDCTYILFNRKILQGEDPLSGISFDTLYNEIIEVNGDTHTVSSYVPGINFRIESTLKQIRQQP